MDLPTHHHQQPLGEIELSEFVDALANEFGLPEYVRQALHASERFTVEVNKQPNTVRIRYSNSRETGSVVLMQK